MAGEGNSLCLSGDGSLLFFSVDPNFLLLSPVSQCKISFCRVFEDNIFIWHSPKMLCLLALSKEVAFFPLLKEILAVLGLTKGSVVLWLPWYFHHVLWLESLCSERDTIHCSDRCTGQSQTFYKFKNLTNCDHREVIGLLSVASHCPHFLQICKTKIVIFTSLTLWCLDE